jgi:hypothetical protein
MHVVCGGRPGYDVHCLVFVLALHGVHGLWGTECEMCKPQTRSGTGLGLSICSR